MPLEVEALREYVEKSPTLATIIQLAAKGHLTVVDETDERHESALASLAVACRELGIENVTVLDYMLVAIPNASEFFSSVYVKAMMDNEDRLETQVITPTPNLAAALLMGFHKRILSEVDLAPLKWSSQFKEYVVSAAKDTWHRASR